VSAPGPAASGQRQADCLVEPYASGIGCCRLPPTFDFRQLVFGPFRDDLAPPEVDLPAIAVDRNPFALHHRGSRELRPAAGDVNRSSITSHDAGLSHLSRDKCGMRGTAADYSHDTGGDGKARDIGGVGIGTHENDGITAVAQPLGARGVESGTPARDARRGADAAGDRIMGFEQPVVGKRAQLDSIEPAERLWWGDQASCTRSIAMRNAARGVRLAVRVCRM
jgi:hypothetical protein